MLRKKKKSMPKKLGTPKGAGAEKGAAKAAEAPMTRLELIQVVGEIIVAVDVARSQYARTSDNRRKLDDFRDALDTMQRRFVRNMFKDDTEEFKRLTAKLKKSNDGLKQSLSDVTRVADTLEGLGKFLGALEKLAGLIFPG